VSRLKWKVRRVVENSVLPGDCPLLNARTSSSAHTGINQNSGKMNTCGNISLQGSRKEIYPRVCAEFKVSTGWKIKPTSIPAVTGHHSHFWDGDRNLIPMYTLTSKEILTEPLLGFSYGRQKATYSGMLKTKILNTGDR